MSAPDGQLYRMSISASGEVRDKDGNLLNEVPIEGEVVVTSEQAAAIRAQLEQGNE